MGGDRHRWDGLGVPAGMLKPGMAVMVPVGTISAMVNGGPAIVAYATVIGPADDADRSLLVEQHDVWWLKVHMGPGVTLPQMYPADQILGVPAVGLTMPQPAAVK